MVFRAGGEWLSRREHSLNGRTKAQTKTIAATNRTLRSIG
jgi:hypothetical protein